MSVPDVSSKTVRPKSTKIRGPVSNHLRDRSRDTRSDQHRRRALRDAESSEKQLQLSIGQPLITAPRTWKLYVLRLESNKYYVGITSLPDVAMRFRKHATGKGAKWTRIHQPLEIIESIDLGKLSQREAERVETARTLGYIKKFGVANVRGGSLCLVSDLNHAKQHLNVSMQ